VVNTYGEFVRCDDNVLEKLDPQAPALPPPSFIHVDCSEYRRSHGCQGFLTDLLQDLKAQAMKQGLHNAAAARAPLTESAQSASIAIQRFFEALPTDRMTYVSVDKAHKFFQLMRPATPSTPDSTQLLDYSEVNYMGR
jgi:hypothetical protein